MRVALVQHDIFWEDKGVNHAVVEDMITEAAIQPGTFVLLPELSDTGFSLNTTRIVDDQSLNWAKGLAKRLGIWLQHGYPAKAVSGATDKARNCAAVITPAGEVAGIYEKIHPFSFGREAESYAGGDKLVLGEVGELRANVCPLICYDLRFPELWRLAARQKAEVFTIGANWPASRQAQWRAMLIARAIENQAFVLAVNRVGSDPTLTYLGGSMIISPMGDVLAEARDQPVVLTAELDLASLRTWRAEFRALDDMHAELLGSINVEHFAGTPVAPSNP